MTNTQLNADVWQWCDMSYAQNQALCLELQNSFMVNVNLLLLAHYLDAKQAAAPMQFTVEQWQSLAQTISEWNEKFLEPYRQLRKLAKSSLQQDEYQQMLDVELMMERKAQRTLLTKLNTLAPQGHHANLVNYLSLFGLSEGDVRTLGLITP